MFISILKKLFNPVALAFTGLLALAVGYLADTDLVFSAYGCALTFQKTLPAVIELCLSCALLLGLAGIFAGVVSLIVGLVKRSGGKMGSGAIGVVVGLIVVSGMLSMLRRERRATNESAAVANLRTINTAEVTYLSEHKAYGDIGDLIRAGLLDDGIGSDRGRAGYRFTISLEATDYSVTATGLGKASCWDYTSNADGVVRYSGDPQRAPTGVAGQPVQ